MLYLTRKIGEAVVIDGAIEVQVVEIKGHAVKLGLSFPSGSSVLRKEVYERIVSENKAAASDGLLPEDRAASPAPDNALLRKLLGLEEEEG
jgi:carbon storage regulator